MSDGYEQRTVVVKHKKEEGKVKRWVVNPVLSVARWENKDSKKDRVSA